MNHNQKRQYPTSEIILRSASIVTESAERINPVDYCEVYTISFRTVDTNEVLNQLRALHVDVILGETGEVGDILP